MRPQMLPYTMAATTKPHPFKTVVTQLADEIDKDGFVTGDQPLLVYLCNTQPKQLAYVKGMARTSVVFAALRFAQLSEWTVQEYLPQLQSTMSLITGVCFYFVPFRFLPHPMCKIG